MAPARAASAHRRLLLLIAAAAAPPSWVARAESMQQVTDRLLVGYSKHSANDLAVILAHSRHTTAQHPLKTDDTAGRGSKHVSRLRLLAVAVGWAGKSTNPTKAQAFAGLGLDECPATVPAVDLPSSPCSHVHWFRCCSVF